MKDAVKLTRFVSLCIAYIAVCDTATAQDPRTEEFLTVLEASFVAASANEFEPLRTTNRLPDGVVAALTIDPLFGGMAEWGDEFQTSDVLGGLPSTKHVISWRSQAHLVVLFVGRGTAFFLADLIQRRGCVYSLGHDYGAVMATIKNLQELLQRDTVGAIGPNCARIIEF